jgi:predicted AAA+ superfamily ATPase
LTITPDDTLLVFDEIQSAPQGITSLKYFCENAREYHIIAAGSLRGVNIHPGESFPVGKVNFMTLYPMSFHEFLFAMGENGIAKLIDSREWELVNAFSAKLNTYLRYYLYVGGMPAAVAEFVKNKDWQAVRTIQKDILASYRNDFSKHAPADVLPRINMVWDSVPAQLAKTNKKFIYGVIRQGGRAKDFEVAIQWITDAGLLHKVYSVSKPAVPLIAYRELSAFKLYHNDVGLLGAMSNLKAKTLVNGNEVFTEFKGALTENYVFQQLKLNGELSLNYHAFENSTYELDFIVQSEEDDLIPIEVKASENLKAKSFRYFCEKHNPIKAIRTSLSDYRKESWMTNVPLYIIGDYFD